MKIFNNKQRKGSLQLSINAIVVLVMAMVVLGLGLGFIRNLIGQGEDKLGGVMSNLDLSNPASASDPLTVLPEVELKRGGTVELQIGFYNSLTETTVSPTFTDTSGSWVVGGYGGYVHCVSADGTPYSAGEFRIASPSATVPSGGEVGFLAILSDGCDATPAPVSPNSCESDNKVKAGTYACQINIYDESSTNGNEVVLASEQIIVYVSN